MIIRNGRVWLEKVFACCHRNELIVDISILGPVVDLSFGSGVSSHLMMPRRITQSGGIHHNN